MNDLERLENDEETPFAYAHSGEFAHGMEALDVSLWITTYQAGKLAVFRSRGGRLSMLARTFDKAMGLAIAADRAAIATRHQVWCLRNETILAPRIKPAGNHDACYIPRASHVTGNIDIHEIAVGGDELWVANTLFCCVCTLDNDYSFVPRWWPPYVTELKRQDRCHLNGLAMVEGRPKYVTAFSETDTPEGWREHKRTGGVLIDVPSGEVVARGFSMPHSPRVHNGQVWVLDSGNGRLVTVDVSNGKIELVAELPGYTRGLALLGNYAFVGLSKVREKNIFGGIPIDERTEERRCGVWVINLKSGSIDGFLEFQQTVDEIFDVQLLPGVRFPAVIGLEKSTIERACVIGPPRQVDPSPTADRIKDA